MVVFCCSQLSGVQGSSLRSHEEVEDVAGGGYGVGLICLLETVSSPVVMMIYDYFKTKADHLGKEQTRHV